MEMEKRVMEMVGQVIASIGVANHVDEIIVALYSLAACLFPLESHTISGIIDEKYRHKLSNLVVTSPQERSEWVNVFYKGSGFLTFSRVLLYDVACDWLACFPTCATKCVYDVFFLNGHATEIVQVLVPCLHLGVAGSYDLNTVTSNAERLIILCLLENDMVLQVAREFVVDDISHEKHKQNMTRTAQLITSIPDKARRGAPIALSPSFFFKRITTYLLRIAEDCDLELVDKSAVANESHPSGLVLFVGEIFGRICRRGSTDVMLSEVIPRILEHIRGVLSTSSDLPISNMFESKFCFRFWSNIIEAVNDSHSVERIAEGLLNQLADENVSDLESYWTLRILFGQICEHRTSVRFIFAEKFLLWKVFPVRCLRWILQFAVLECPPDNLSEKKSYSTSSLLETVHRLVKVWSNNEFVQSSPTERQTYLTATLGLCLEKMTKEDLDVTKGVLPSILQGISCRLESPVYLIRKMASCIALVFSKVIDPEHPLYLDDSCIEDPIDWEFGLANPSSGGGTGPLRLDHNPDDTENSTILDETHKRSIGVGNTFKTEVNISLLDPDEIIDPATLIDELTFGGDDSDGASEDSGNSIDSSLEPYDLLDDDTDLKKKFSQLVDVVGALRKPDDAEGVESALDAAEALIRALPDELKYIASDLAKILVQVRCSESANEGEEDSSEDKRQKALVALVVACPVETLDSLNKLFYSANLDISQRIMILDVMTESAQELACTKFIKKPEKYQKPLITFTSDQPWFVPRNTGPSGAGSWKEISSSGNPLNWSYSYERELPSREGIGKGKTRIWSNRIKGNEMEWSQNKFPHHVAAFMLPFMREFDKKRHGVDLLGRDFIVLGKLIHMLGVCMKCAAMHPEASVLATPLLDMLRSREICRHKEAYVRRSVLFAASCVLVALHPSYVTSAVVEGNLEVSQGLDWVRAWSLQVAESDNDKECHSLAMACLQLHSEMALQVSRALESANDRPISTTKTISRSSINLPFLHS